LALSSPRLIRRLRFLHIPRTAGTTFTQILLRQYRGKARFQFTGEIGDDVRRYNDLSESERENVFLFIGHAPIATGVPAADGATVITFLRDPIARVRSFCQHVYAGKVLYLRDEFPPESFDLGRFLRSGKGELSNLQTKMLINRGVVGSPYLIEKMSASGARDLALENLLHRIAGYGLQERFDESVIAFSAMLNWSIPVYVSVNRSASSGRLEFEPRHLEQIAALNAIDAEVYETAKVRFANAQRDRRFIQGRLAMFRLIRRLFAARVSAASRIRGRTPSDGR